MGEAVRIGTDADREGVRLRFPSEPQRRGGPDAGGVEPRSAGGDAGKLTDVPPVLLPLVERYGVERVRAAWCRVFEYPFTWATDIREALNLAQVLEV